MPAKKPLSEAQKAGLAKGRAARAANIRGRRARRAQQGASGQISQLAAIANQPGAAVAEPENLEAAPASAPLTASGKPFSANKANKARRSKLTQDEQDKLIFEFNEGEGSEQGQAASAGDGAGERESGKSAGGQGLGSRVKQLFTAAPRAESAGGITDAQEQDAQQAAAQWQGLLAVVFIWIGARTFGTDLRPSDEMAGQMAAPLARIAMRHIAPLRTASADTYDIVAFMTACIVYYQAIEPALTAKRAERQVISSGDTQTKARYQSNASPEPEPIPTGPRYQQSGNVTILDAADTARGRRYNAQPLENSGTSDERDTQQPHDNDAGTALYQEIIGVHI